MDKLFIQKLSTMILLNFYYQFYEINENNCKVNKVINIHTRKYYKIALLTAVVFRFCRFFSKIFLFNIAFSWERYIECCFSPIFVFWFFYMFNELTSEYLSPVIRKLFQYSQIFITENSKISKMHRNKTSLLLIRINNFV